mmetsp:Transcript_5960/g.8050  ORF Transcript_5960/g.8050 Transcript_5960/m.8050 type:complete len:220 (-) Transcript_5960:272-931(-)|eukprot:CAMPEP_0196578998 /NCGR_PEP_ID=MMETSP1081-20130531/15623_1 /TAXON_ID=36882 /ORGANISM="Pyramimonas amylifera, Strain CCMP720" /LENGTH=219 /DNA_ID=CAMNT_0041898421 /DNA_START=45 /DNA_END=704 /DNA_ORIENTATION=-
MERPKSAVRRPASSRARPSSLPAGAAPPIPARLLDSDDEDSHWLFSTAYRLTTTDISLAGFTTAVLLDAMRWQPNPEDELSPEETAAAEVAYTFGFPESSTPPVISLANKSIIVEGLKHAFVGRGGDLLIIFQNVGSGEGSALGEGAGADRAMNIVAMVLDCVNAAYAAADAEGLEGLAGVSVVLEGFARTGMFQIAGSWDSGQQIQLEVQAFTDALPS